MLLGRLQERAALSRLLEAARSGRSGVLVVRGEPGVGKTALLEHAIESAAGLRVARVAGVESEMELAFAALQQLCAPIEQPYTRGTGPRELGRSGPPVATAQLGDSGDLARRPAEPLGYAGHSGTP